MFRDIVFAIAIMLLIIVAYAVYIGWRRAKESNVKPEPYTNSIIQDLIRYHAEYYLADSSEDKETVVAVIKMQHHFAKLDPKEIPYDVLRLWFTDIINQDMPVWKPKRITPYTGGINYEN